MLSLPSNSLLIFVLTSVTILCHGQEKGTDHLLKQSPWFITLYITCPSLGAIKTCKGSLIHNDWVLTTATCVQCEDDNTIPMIVADVGSASDNAQDVFHSGATGVGRYIVDKIVIHNKFSKSTNNIALLHLQYPVVSSSRHTMMQVSRCYEVDEAKAMNSLELLSDYAMKTDDLNSSLLLGDKMKMMKRKRCKEMSATCKGSKAMSSGEFCATFIQHENLSCNYDEGMALGVRSGEEWIVTGFVHEKPKDCVSCPVWFMDVCKYYEWVKNIISSASMTQDTKCPPLNAPGNGNLIGVPEHTEATVGTTAEFFCPLGSTPNTSNMILCQNDGTWSGPAPRCTPLDKCPRLQQPFNGRILYQPQNSYVGSEVIYQCNGQEGEISRKCLSGGMWENLAAECKSIDPPNNVKATVLAPKIIEVSWDPFVSADVTSYLITYTTTAVYATGGNVTVYGHNVSKVLLTKLEENTLYSITVQAVSVNTFSGPSSVASVITWASAPSAAPRNVTAVSVDPSAISVSWIPPLLVDHNGDLIGYTLLYSKADSNDVQSVQLLPNVTMYEITQLVPSTEYRVWVSCINANGTGPFSTTITVLSESDKICQDVRPVSNGWVTYSGHLVDDTVKYHCNNGYTRNGPMTRRCLASGKWTGKRPRCEKICPKPTNPSNGHVNYTNTTFSSLARYTCNNGYRINGVSVLQCISGGLWNNTPPTCQAIVGCGIPPSPINGYVQYTSTSFHSVATYHCNKKHKLLGYDSTTCQVGRKWSGVVPLCRRLCPEVSDQPYRNRLQYDRTIGGITKFSCISDFIMFGVPEIRCKSNGKWNQQEPICYKECPNAPQTPNGKVVQSGTRFGDTANYTCNFGYRLAIGHIPYAVCQRNGQWIRRPPTCVQITCPRLNNPLNGYVNSNSTAVLSRVTFSCHTGYELVGNNVTVCHNDSTWTNPIPQCKRLCPKLTHPNNGSITFTKLYEGSYANYSCDPGYDLLGSSVIVCTSTGKWNPAPPICYKACGDPNPINNGKVVISGRIPGSNATYSCNDRYRLVGNATVLCQPDSQWLGEVPKCKEIRCPKIKSIHNGTVMLSNRTIGDKINYTCNSGYILYGPATRNCTNQGSWTGINPSCIRNCDTPSNITNGFVTLRTTKEALVADYSCEAGYVLIGNESITCNSDGKWTETANICEEISPLNCSAPSTIQHGGVYVYSLPTYVKIARYYCDSGYFLVGNRTRDCLGRNIWSDAEPVCKKFCDNPLPLSNGRVSVLATRTGQVAQYSCNDGYVLLGVSSRECAPNGKWKNSTPSCESVL